MKIIITAFILAFSLFTANAAENFYDLEAITIDGDTLHFSQYQGKKLLIVNVASECKYTPQYAGLQSLYDKYGGDKFEIIGFPSNNFGSQEPGTDPDIKDFCQKNYGVTFQMMSKITVINPDMHPVYQWLTSKEKNGVVDSDVLWNFQKYLINEDGTLHTYTLSNVDPLDPLIVSWVESTTDIDESEFTNSSFKVYPNPATDVINVSNINEEITIYTILGNEVLKVDSSTGTIDISSLQPGMYLIKSGTNYSRFVKQ